MQKIKTSTLLFGIVGATVVATVSLFVYSTIVSYREAPGVVSAKVDALFDSVQMGTFPETYNTMTTTELRAITSQQEYEKYGKQWARLGKLKKKTLQSIKFIHSPTLNLHVAYDSEFENASNISVASSLASCQTSSSSNFVTVAILKAFSLITRNTTPETTLLTSHL